MTQAAALAIGAQRAESPGLWTLAWRRFCRDRVGLASFLIVVFFFGLMVASGLHLIAADWSKEVGVNFAPPTFVGPAISDSGPTAPFAAESPGIRPSAGQGEIEIVDPLAGVLAEIRAASGAAAAADAQAPTLVFGGDRWGRDVLKKAIKGTETSMFVGLVAALLAAFLATVFGALAGYYGGWIDDFFNWFYSVFTSIPYLLLILAIAAVLNQKGTLTVILILGLTGWTDAARLVRAEARRVRSTPFVEAARAVGDTDSRIILRHILPNVLNSVVVLLTLQLGFVIIVEATLSFLGAGIPPPTPTWGLMISEGRGRIADAWWVALIPGIAITLMVLSVNLFGDWLRDRLDPRLRQL